MNPPDRIEQALQRQAEYAASRAYAPFCRVSSPVSDLRKRAYYDGVSDGIKLQAAFTRGEIKKLFGRTS